VLDLIVLYKADAQFVAMLAVLAAAFVWGAGPERASASAFAYMLLVYIPLHYILGLVRHYSTIDIGALFIDITTAALFVAIALRANRMYPLWLAALQLISLASHLIRGIDRLMLPLAYSVMNIAPSYLELIIIAGGIVCHARREKRYGPYRSWRNSSSHSRAAGPNASPKG
jgi:hypothetical protein